ncbi:MAG: hypothetical protein NTW87_01390 [Planctomycetota bacterium]|nr:hypothetical protein [Planctomycetota bacterium]
MQHKAYKPNVKAAILKAAGDARKAGKKWSEALQAAKAAGYRGGLVSLILFVKGKRKRARRAAAKATTAKAPAQAAGKLTGGLRYDAATKAAIIKAAVAARRAGKTWPQALEVAKAAGFRGKGPRLIRFVQSASKAAKKPVRKAAPKARPAKAAAPAAPTSDLKVLEATLSGIVKQRVRGVLDAAIAVLQRARDEA